MTRLLAVLTCSALLAATAAAQEKKGGKKGRYGEVSFSDSCERFLCKVEEPSGSIRKQDLEAMFNESCTLLLKAFAYMDEGGGFAYDKMPGSLRLWLMEMDPKNNPNNASQNKVRFKDILLGALTKCKKGIAFKCNSCDETSTSFKIPGNSTTIPIINPDVRLCPGLCKRSKDTVKINLIHEITHFGGADDDDKVACMMPDRFEGMIPQLAAEYDKMNK